MKSNLYGIFGDVLFVHKIKENLSVFCPATGSHVNRKSEVVLLQVGI
jgi:hypothetical protein